jgi:hypothetical protein
MAITKTDVVNRALSKIGSAKITSLDDDVSREARESRNVYEIALRNELRLRKWSFSIKRSSLALEVTVPLDINNDFTKQFALPSDYIRLISTSMSYAPDSYSLEGNKVLTNVSEFRVRYIAYISDPNAWDASFLEVFACRLAMELAEPLTQSTEKFTKAERQYDKAIAFARVAGSLEHASQSIEADTWEMSRNI